MCIVLCDKTKITDIILVFLLLTENAAINKFFTKENGLELFRGIKMAITGNITIPLLNCKKMACQVCNSFWVKEGLML